MRVLRCVALLSLIAVSMPAVSAPARAGDLSGHVCVMNGDTVMMGGRRRYAECEGGQVIHLWGIAGFKLDQLCRHPSGRNVMCGLYSAAQLQDRIKKNKIRCEQKDTKPGGVIVARCFLDKEDLGQFMVENGFAVADPRETQRYTGYEAAAKAARKGLWQTQFVPPWQWHSN